MLNIFVCCLLFATSALADLTLSGPLLTDSTVVEVSTKTETSVKGTPCFTTTAAVTECRRKRGFQEKPDIFHVEQSLADIIEPSEILS